MAVAYLVLLERHYGDRLMNTTMFACGTRTFCASVLLAALSATGAEYYWVPGATDWTAKESYANADGTAAGKVPSPGDELAII